MPASAGFGDCFEQALSVLGAAGAYAAYRLADWGHSRWRPLAAGLAVALHPALVPYTAGCMTEGITASLLLLGAAAASRAKSTGGWIPLVTTSFVMAIATPGRSAASVTNAAARNADRLQQAAQEAETQVHRFLANGHRNSSTLALQRAQATRQAADRARRHAEWLAEQHAPPRLTQREVEILTLASHGCSYTEIAEQLVLSTATVKTHLRHCYTKLAVPDKAAELVLTVA